MDTQTPKPKFRWGRLFLIILVSILLMIVGYVGGNLLQKYLAKRLQAYQDAERERQRAEKAEDVEHEEVDDFLHELDGVYEQRRALKMAEEEQKDEQKDEQEEESKTEAPLPKKKVIPVPLNRPKNAKK